MTLVTIKYTDMERMFPHQMNELDYKFIEADENLDYVLLTLTNHLQNKNLKRGDIVALEGYGHRNEGKFIFDGKSVISLSYDLDEYGHLPKEFHDFPPGHFTDVIDHNHICWFEFLNPIESKKVIDDRGEEYYQGECSKYGKKWTLVGKSPNFQGIFPYEFDTDGDFWCEPPVLFRVTFRFV